jgi:methionine synthase II (cobalamin-independent)
MLPTCLVGSYPQPEWLIDRARLSKQVPRVRAREAGFATVVTETMKAGDATIKVERYRITDDGREAVATEGQAWQRSLSDIAWSMRASVMIASSNVDD